MATWDLLSRAGEAVSCRELGHGLKKDQQAPLPTDLWLYTCYRAVLLFHVKKRMAERELSLFQYEKEDCPREGTLPDIAFAVFPSSLLKWFREPGLL